MSSTADELAQLRAENERLRAQVAQAASMPPSPALRAQPQPTPAPTPAAVAAEKKEDTDLIMQALSEKAFTVVVLGASGDLAKKKTYPALYALFRQGLIPTFVTVCGCVA